MCTKIQQCPHTQTYACRHCLQHDVSGLTDWHHVDKQEEIFCSEALANWSPVKEAGWH